MGDSIEKVCEYLRERGVVSTVIERFRAEKMDISAVLNATEGILEELGLVKVGDRLNLIAFCKSVHQKSEPTQTSQEDTIKKKKALLEAFITKKRMKTSENSNRSTCMPIQEKKEKIKAKKIQLGWKHFREEDKTYNLVPLSKGGGSRTVHVSVAMSKFELYQTSKDLFFPNGQSIFGNADDMFMDMSNFKDEKICETLTVDGKTVLFNINNYVEAYKIKSIRLYLRSRKLCDDHESDNELNHSPFEIESDDDMPMTRVNKAVSLIDSSEDRTKDLIEEQDKAYQVSLETDNYCSVGYSQGHELQW